MKYDVFISYRREDGKEYARQIQLKLENYGYSVFLDVEELKDGVFDKRITDAIRSSKVFIALLTPKYLCRSHNPQDWVRKEIECAVYNDIHIVPVNIDRLWTDFPVDCPDNVRQHLGQHQYSEIFTGSQFTNTMNDLNEHRLRPYIKVSDIVQPTTGALLRVRADMDCRVVKYGEDVGLMFAG
ncbi:MAG: toll/interleukin-1 receptor domain-containing protein, partial [Alistipes sp.]|nr:toll/interleukin-1 receptor domain-containing protein [Alistipes sp.]